MTNDQQPITRVDLDRAVESIIGNLSEVRAELATRFDTLERRIDRVETNTNALLLQTAGMSQSLTAAERLDTATAATLAGMQRAIDDLYAQVAELKRRLQQ